MPVKLKTCIRCRQALPLEMFYRAGAYRQSRCKRCHVAWAADRGRMIVALEMANVTARRRMARAGVCA